MSTINVGVNVELRAYINGEQVEIEEYVKAVREYVDSLQAKIAALKDAARPLVDDWRTERVLVTDLEDGKLLGCAAATVAQLDALAALVEEE